MNFIDLTWVAIAALATADAVTGFLHWVEDKHPEWVLQILGEWSVKAIIVPNMIHHDDPFAMTKDSYWSRVCHSTLFAIPILAAGILLESWFLILFAIFASQANQIHYWAHVVRPPLIVRWLQYARIFQSRRHHSVHHKAPFDVRFCVMTPWLNPIIDYLTKGWRSRRHQQTTGE